MQQNNLLINNAISFDMPHFMSLMLGGEEGEGGGGGVPVGGGPRGGVVGLGDEKNMTCASIVVWCYHRGHWFNFIKKNKKKHDSP